jgi:hypothetical protein
MAKTSSGTSAKTGGKNSCYHERNNKHFNEATSPMTKLMHLSARMSALLASSMHTLTMCFNFVHNFIINE